ncbi:SurA N-terminal domain-containing protein [Candidatus Pelagibacter sp.]|nr:SurA N-terminal domain-containing protein [Candidatus Pelagibacter sp.]MDC0333733.1 SurA N-terminal domain-containing protein [Candidatus Pelagibacter sp.]MDC0997183.1 SurA N-terminal domain-containing protein [Candidatus Pelagibacter sp.]
METLKNFGVKKLGGVILIVIIVIAFGFGGFGGGFSTNNQNNIAKINKTNVTTQDFMDYLNQSNISQQAIRENLDKNIIEELLSGLISTTLIDLEVEDFDLSITELTVLKKIKENKNFHDENGAFQRTKYEKFLLSNNMSAPMFEIQLKNRELQKHLFDLIGAGTITPDFLIKKMFEEQNKTLDIEYFAMSSQYKEKNSYTNEELEQFVKENADQLKRDFIDFKYAVLNPKNLIGLEEFNQEFFDEIDKIENKISQGDTFDSILENINVDIKEVNKFVASSAMESNEDIIYSKKSTKLDLIENGDNFLLYSITDKYELAADLNDEATRDDMIELVYQKGKFDLNRSVLEEIQKKEFDNNKFNEMGANNLKTISLNSIKDHDTFEENSVKILYSLPINSFTLVSDKDNEIYLVKIINSKDKPYSENDDNYLKFVQNQNTENRKSILASYDQLLNNKYNVQLNQKTIDRVKNYFK